MKHLLWWTVPPWHCSGLGTLAGVHKLPRKPKQKPVRNNRHLRTHGRGGDGVSGATRWPPVAGAEARVIHRGECAAGINSTMMNAENSLRVWESESRGG
jgi:hypothetical protein